LRGKAFKVSERAGERGGRSVNASRKACEVGRTIKEDARTGAKKIGGVVQIREKTGREGKEIARKTRSCTFECRKGTLRRGERKSNELRNNSASKKNRKNPQEQTGEDRRVKS